MAEVHDGATLRAALLEIAGDFSFTWIAEARRLFMDLEPRRFAELKHNPTALLSELTDDDLARALTDEVLLARLIDDVIARAPDDPARRGPRPRAHLAALIPAGHGMAAVATILLAVLTAVTAAAR